MKLIISIYLIVSLVTVACADPESAIDIAKRVIADQSSPHTPRDSGIISSGLHALVPPPRSPEDDKLEAAGRQSQDILAAYWLSDDVPEKIRIAYAINLLATKRNIWSPPSGMPPVYFGTLEQDKIDGYLQDGLILVARLAEIEEAEQAASCNH